MLCLGCNPKHTQITKEDNTQQMIDYIINKDLSSKGYSDVKGYFPNEGLVPTVEIAFQIAEPILVNLYGRETIEEEKPFSINLENDIWIIEGTLEKGFKGGVAYMEISKINGTILKVIHTK